MLVLKLQIAFDDTMHSSAKFQAPPNAVDLLNDLVKANEGVFLLCFLGQIVT